MNIFYIILYTNFILCKKLVANYKDIEIPKFPEK